MKTSSYLLFFLLIGTSAIAQSNHRTRAYVRAGIGASRAIGSKAYSVAEFNLDTGSPLKPLTPGGENWLTAGQVSVGFTQPLKGQFYIQVEAGLERKGSARDMTVSYFLCGVVGCSGVTYVGVGSSRITYLTVPVLFGYRFSKLSLAAGPYLSYKLGENQWYVLTTDNLNPPRSLTGLVLGKYNDLDAGFSVNLAYALSSRFGLDLRYSQGLTSLAKSDNQLTEKSYHQSAQLGVTYTLTR